MDTAKCLQRYVRHIPYVRHERYAWAGCAVVTLGLALASDLGPHRVWEVVAGVTWDLLTGELDGERQSPPRLNRRAFLVAVLLGWEP